jgi:hypothetical protein
MTPNNPRTKKNTDGLPAELPPDQKPTSQPHGTTEDQINEMESEGQATKPGQRPLSSPSTPVTPTPSEKKDEKHQPKTPDDTTG